MKQVLGILISVLVLSSCGFEQDPLKGAPDAVRDGKPPVIVEKPELISEEAVKIDAPSFANGLVETPLKLSFSGRVLLEGVEYRKAVLNLESFPGATFNEETGEFSWTPSKELLGTRPEMRLPLTVMVYTVATKKYPKVQSRSKQIDLLIVNKYTRPIIQNILGPDQVVTGQDYVYYVNVNDIDTPQPNNVTVLLTDCEGSVYSKNLGALIQVSEIRRMSWCPMDLK